MSETSTMQFEGKLVFLVDIWGGEHSRDHVARFITTKLDLRHIYCELVEGYVVNIREVSEDGIPWGPKSTFDNRRAGDAG